VPFKLSHYQLCARKNNRRSFDSLPLRFAQRAVAQDDSKDGGQDDSEDGGEDDSEDEGERGRTTEWMDDRDDAARDFQGRSGWFLTSVGFRSS
jgi:hypothetical protein